MNAQIKRRRGTDLRLEALEDRNMLTASATLSSGLLIIQGTPQADSVMVQYSANKAMVQLVDENDNIIGSFSRSSVGQINFFGGDGNDTFVNNTSITCNAFGEGGDDLLAGGSGVNYLYGGDGDDILLGGTGSAAGTNIISGDAGHDIIDGGDGKSIIFADSDDRVVQRPKSLVVQV